MKIALTRKSSNAKIGKIPCTTSSRNTCPSSCPLINNGCYASAGFHTRLHWDKVTSGERGSGLASFTSDIESLKPGQLWRHNVAGDLMPKSENVIDKKALMAIAKANKGKRGFTYTHYPMSKKANREAIIAANNAGFTVNASCDNPAQAAKLARKHSFPIVTIVPGDYWETGNQQGDIVRCPAEYRDKVTCESCKLCSVSDRKVIVGFTVHGRQSKSADVIARG